MDRLKQFERFVQSKAESLRRELEMPRFTKQLRELETLIALLDKDEVTWQALCRRLAPLDGADHTDGDRDDGATNAVAGASSSSSEEMPVAAPIVIPDGFFRQPSTLARRNAATVCPALSRLELDDTSGYAQSTQLADLFRLLQSSRRLRCHVVTHFSMKHIALPPIVSSVASFVSLYQSLTHLRLTKANLGDDAAAMLLPALEGQPSLKQLNLTYNRLSHPAALLRFLIRSPSVEFVDISFNFFGFEEGEVGARSEPTSSSKGPKTQKEPQNTAAAAISSMISSLAARLGDDSTLTTRGAPAPPLTTASTSGVFSSARQFTSGVFETDGEVGDEATMRCPFSILMDGLLRPSRSEALGLGVDWWAPCLKGIIVAHNGIPEHSYRYVRGLLKADVVTFDKCLKSRALLPRDGDGDGDSASDEFAAACPSLIRLDLSEEQLDALHGSSSSSAAVHQYVPPSGPVVVYQENAIATRSWQRTDGFLIRRSQRIRKLLHVTDAETNGDPNQEEEGATAVVDGDADDMLVRGNSTVRCNDRIFSHGGDDEDAVLAVSSDDDAHHTDGEEVPHRTSATAHVDTSLPAAVGDRQPTTVDQDHLKAILSLSECESHNRMADYANESALRLAICLNATQSQNALCVRLQQSLDAASRAEWMRCQAAQLRHEGEVVALASLQTEKEPLQAEIARLRESLRVQTEHHQKLSATVLERMRMLEQRRCSLVDRAVATEAAAALCDVSLQALVACEDKETQTTAAAAAVVAGCCEEKPQWHHDVNEGEHDSSSSSSRSTTADATREEGLQSQQKLLFEEGVNNG